jgi:hypothetical protein
MEDNAFNRQGMRKVEHKYSKQYHHGNKDGDAGLDVEVEAKQGQA